MQKRTSRYFPVEVRRISAPFVAQASSRSSGIICPKWGEGVPTTPRSSSIIPAERRVTGGGGPQEPVWASTSPGPSPGSCLGNGGSRLSLLAKYRTLISPPHWADRQPPAPSESCSKVPRPHQLARCGTSPLPLRVCVPAIEC